MVKSGRDASYHHGDLRQALIDGAVALIRENQDGKTLSMREVARRAGVSNAAPYRHFADKDALLAAVALVLKTVLEQVLSKEQHQDSESN